MTGRDIIALVVILAVGLGIGLWQLAILTNWRGYGGRHVTRSIRSGSVLRRLPPYRSLPASDSDATRRFATWTQKAVAAVLMLAGFAMVAFAVVALVTGYSPA